MAPRRLTRAVLCLALLAFGGLAAYWFWAAGQVETAIARWTEEQRARGYEISYRGPELNGFPVRLAVGFSEPRVAAPGGWRWSGAAINGQAAFWEPWVLRLDLPLEQTLSAEWRGHRRELALNATAARGLIHLGRDGWLEAATVEMERVVLTEEGGGNLRAETLRYQLTRRPPTLEGGDDWTLLLAGETLGIALPEGVTSPLGERVERLAFDVSLTGVIPGVVPGGTPAAALARWRDSGGLVEVRDLALAWGPLYVTASGTATLDQMLRPQGAFTARIRGLPKTLDALVERNLIESGVAFALKLTALTLASGNDGDGRAVVELPITLQDGLFYLGPVALFRLAPVL
ncbi:MAG: DUF2125 domain-containing protein [Alphaproteobacteria bacterium]